MTFGATLLRQLRDAAGLTQEELASRAGLTAKAVSALERGARKRPYPHTVRALAEALDLSDDERAALIEAVPRRDGGSLSALENRQERAVRILAAVDALRREIGFEFQAHTLTDYERAVQRAREALTVEQFEAAWQRGSAMSLDEAARYAMSGG